MQTCYFGDKGSNGEPRCWILVVPTFLSLSRQRHLEIHSTVLEVANENTYIQPRSGIRDQVLYIYMSFPHICTVEVRTIKQTAFFLPSFIQTRSSTEGNDIQGGEDLFVSCMRLADSDQLC